MEAAVENSTPAATVASTPNERVVVAVVALVIAAVVVAVASVVVECLLPRRWRSLRPTKPSWRACKRRDGDFQRPKTTRSSSVVAVEILESASVFA